MISKIRTQRVRILLPHPHSSLLDSGPRSKLPSVHPPKRTPSDLLLSKDRGGAVIPEWYSDPVSECRAVRTAAGIFDFSFRAKFSAGGSDRVRFIHGMVSND